MTDVESFEPLEPVADGYRNWQRDYVVSAEEQLLLDRTQLMAHGPRDDGTGRGMRVLGTNHGGSPHGVFTDRVGTLSNDFHQSDRHGQRLETGRQEPLRDPRPQDRPAQMDRHPGRSGLGSNSILRAYAEVYAQDDNKGKFVRTSSPHGAKVMDADRFDLD